MYSLVDSFEAVCSSIPTTDRNQSVIEPLCVFRQLREARYDMKIFQKHPSIKRRDIYEIMFFRKDEASAPTLHNNSDAVMFDGPVSVAPRMHGSDGYVPYENPHRTGYGTGAVHAVLNTDECPCFLDAEAV